jgi:hypothetical protein
MNRSTQPHATGPNACPVCCSYSPAQRRHLADAGPAYWQQLDRIRDEERTDSRPPPLPPWERPDMMTWRPT